jgi:cold shock CspA family protein
MPVFVVRKLRRFIQEIWASRLAARKKRKTRTYSRARMVHHNMNGVRWKPHRSPDPLLNAQRIKTQTHQQLFSSPSTIMTDKIKGTVKWFSNRKGFGFITPSSDNSPTTEDIFVHQSNIVTEAEYRTLVRRRWNTESLES